MRKHVFAICAYEESPYIEKCIISLKRQTMNSDIMVFTSTPNAFLKNICKKHMIPLRINDKRGGITEDWNYAYENTNAEYVTITHQDDIYSRRYAETVSRLLDHAKDPIIFFSDYGEIRGETICVNSRLLNTKRFMLLPLRNRMNQQNIWIRRRILSLGSPICCPSVTFVKRNCPRQIFQHGFRSNEDWQAWEKLSRRKGAFVYDSEILMLHRIHADSETTKILQDDGRSKEDYIMFKKFWIDPIAKLLTVLYKKSEESNNIL